ncbi:hypothetical protein [Nocardioides ochotonae]|uniref:hypothetical protein n=1 Tax=Nocardioides ochotonae TaxID=2685869 RepID=UPI0017497161|nr:hypothetical protein [Nocardioides ochotonae]
MVMRVRGRGRSAVVGVVAIAVAVAVVAAIWVSGRDEDRARVVDGPAPPGWLRLAYGDVQVSVPDDWDRRSTGDCVSEAEHWGPPTQAGCGHRRGVHFVVDLDTFDPASEPGVVTRGLDAEDPSWHGYVRLGDVVVSVSDADRAVVRRVLRSVSIEGFQPI